MAKSIIYAIAILCLFEVRAFGEVEGGKDNDTVTLYQVGKNGSYCVSLSPSEKGCISGTDQGGGTINVMSLMKNKTVIFRNVSDAAHDMKFTGANAQELPAQEPNGDAAQKKLAQEDPSKQRITCSYHGAQLAVGYNVTPRGTNAIMGGGHKDPVSGEGGPDAAAAGKGAGGGGKGPVGSEGPTGIGKVTNTRLADVSKEVLARGRASDVSKLVSARPELMAKLQEVRPLLAQEIGAGKNAGGAGGFPTNAAKALGNLTPTGLNFVGVDTNGPKGANGAGGSALGGGGAGGAGGKAGTKVASGTLADSLGAMATDLDGPGGAAKKRRLTDFTGVAPEEGTGQRVAANGANRSGSSMQKLTGTNQAGVGSNADRGIASDNPRLKGVRIQESLDDVMAWDWNRWLILLLLVMAAITARYAIKGTSAKKKKRAA